ncbi:MAG: fatty acyl-AMP ligase [Acidimicrobiia bacterium]|nr:fatty acyl-AMP ligase [Acidimicrobiia bacterium]
MEAFPVVTSLIDRIEAGVQTGTQAGAGITFLGSAAADRHAERLSWAELHDDAAGMAAALQALGVVPGDRVAIIGPTSRPLVTAIQATWLAGATVVCLPLPMRLGSIESFTLQTRARIANAQACMVLVDPELEPFLATQPGDPPVVRLPELRGSSAAWERPVVDAESLAVLQFTSGSTDDPKGVMLPHRCVVNNIDAIVHGAGLGAGDVGVSWLPLYHDMGLIGMLSTPMTTGFDLAIAPPQDFLAAPADWMRWMSEYRATLACGPNFAYALAARALRRVDDLDLSQWRLALNGAEPIDPGAVEAFLETGAKHGLSPAAAFCVYGMAEATLAISFPEPGSGMSVDTVDRTTLEHERYAAEATRPEDARRLALLGKPLRGLEVRVCDPDTGAPQSDREVGELELRGNSVTPGYWQRDDVTRATLWDGWLRTGDLGYMVDGQVVVCGRIKDVIIVGGRNVFPEEIERACAAVEGVRPGNVIAFGTDTRRGKEGIVVVAETRADADAPLRVRDEVVDRVCDVVGIPPYEVILVQAGSLPKTSSGKLQRSLCRMQYLEDNLVLL